MTGLGQDGPDLQGSSVRRLTRIAVAAALAVVGSAVKLPGPVGSVALDSWPGYLLALSGGMDGPLVALAGHLASGMVAGFPLGLLLHVVVAVEMAICAITFRWIARKAGLGVGVAATVFLNGIAAPLSLGPWLGFALSVSLIVPLSVAAGVNVVLASVLYKAVGSRLFPDAS